MKLLREFLFFIVIVALSIGCKEKKTISVNEDYFAKIEKHRIDTDEWMKTNPQSPFNAKGKNEFHPLKYFSIDENFVFKSKLFPYDKRETVKVFGTKGEEREAYKLGYLKFIKDEKEYRLKVYANIGQGGKVYHSTWFTDRTTGKETYDVGRYLEFEFKENQDFIYTIDFNLAFNPYCAYSPDYSCAVPLKEDFLDLHITAGEMKFHD